MRLVAAATSMAFSVFCALLATVPGDALAGTCTGQPPKINFDRGLGSPFFAAAPASDASFPTGGVAFTYHVATTITPSISTILRKYNSGDMSQTPVCTATIAGEKAVADPTPVPLSDGNTAIFLATDAGRIYRFDTIGCGSTWTPAWGSPADIRRRSPLGTLVCTASGQLDTLAAAPSVMLSNPAYYKMGVTTPTKDLVIVPTHYGCTSQDNRVIALDAATGAVVWRSNILTAPSDYFSDACTIDYNTGLVYCGANDPGAAFQNTLYAYDGSKTGTNNPVLALKPGAVSTRLNIRNNHLIVGTNAGVLMGYDLTGVAQGTTFASLPAWSVNLGAPIRKSPVAEQRYGFSRTILVVTSDGHLHRVDEDPAFTAARVGPPLSPATDGTLTGGLFSTNLAMFSEQGKVYAGATDGFMYQIDFTGAVFDPVNSIQAYVAAIPGSIPNGGGTTTATVYDPLLDFAPSATPTVDRLTMSSTNNLRQYQIPWTTSCDSTATWPGSNGICNNVTNPCPAPASPTCAVPVCLASGQCAFTVKPGSQGVACSDGLPACTGGNGTCSDGRCVAVNNSRCNLDALGNANSCSGTDVNACGPGLTCCNSVCVALNNNSDVHNCGGCGVDCDPTNLGDHLCRGGHCERRQNCAAPTAATLKGSAVTSKIDHLTFDYTPGTSCNLYGSMTTANHRIFRLDSAGNGGFLTPRGANYSAIALNGSAITRDAFFSVANHTAGNKSDPNIGISFLLVGSPDVFSPLIPAAFQVGSGVYSDVNFDTDAVGPVFNDLYVARDLQRRVYIADLPNTRNLAYVDATLSGGVWSYSAPRPAHASYPARITALTFAIRPDGGQGEGTLYVAYNDAAGETFIDVFCNPAITNKGKPCRLPTRTLELGPKDPLDFADGIDPDPALRQPPIIGVLSMSTDPTYGGVFATVRDRKGNIQMLYIDSVGLSARNFSTWPYLFPLRGAVPAPAVLGLPTDDIRPAVSQFQLWGLKLNGFQSGDYQATVYGTPR